MKLRTFTVYILLAAAIKGYAQTEVVVNDTVKGKAEKIEVPESMEEDFDRSKMSPVERENLQVDKDCDTTTAYPVFAPEVYKQRLQQIPSAIELPYNEVVRTFIDRYATELRNSVSFMLGVSNFYMPLFEQALETERVPLDLKYLPVIESALNPTAVSRVGAKGLWQFMIATAKKYGLVVNSLVDERCDPVKSSYAAAAYLKDLHEYYGDWTLAIAAYNCGKRQVDKAIRRSGGKKDYWAIYNRLPKETRGYVPAFIAANYIMNFYCDHHICPMQATLPAQTDTVVINRNLNMQQVAVMFNVDIERLRTLNPQYRTDLIPGLSGPCTLRMPQDLIDKFIEAGDSVYNFEVSGYKPRRTEVEIGGGKKSVQPSVKEEKTVQTPVEKKPAETPKDEATDDITRALRKANASDNEDKMEKAPSSTTQRTTRRAASKRANNNSSRAKVKSQDKDEGDDDEKKSTRRRSSSSRVRKSKNSEKKATKKSSSRKTSAKVSSKKKKSSESHTVKSGDTLSELAEKYNTTVSKLKKLNKIKGNTIQKGKKIKVK